MSKLNVVGLALLGTLPFAWNCSSTGAPSSNTNTIGSAGAGGTVGGSTGGAPGSVNGNGGATQTSSGGTTSPSAGAPGSAGASGSLGVGGAVSSSGQAGSAVGGATNGFAGSGAQEGGRSGGGEPSGGGTSGGGAQTGGAGGSGGEIALGGSTSSGGETGAGCGLPAPESGSRTIDVGGVTREYILKVPDDYQPDSPHKLIFAFHARGGNATQVAGGGNDDYYGLYGRSGGSAIFVSPEGLDAGWRNTDGRDIAFVRAMLDTLSAELCIDSARIFSTGFSFGGMMSDAIGCAMADVFRAIAPMAGAIPNPEHPYSGCDQLNQHPIAVWMAHGDNDTTVPFADGMDALDIFLARSECGTETVAVDPSPCVAYQGCLADYPIQLCKFSGGHQVPSFAADAIWSFFNQF